MNMKPFELVGKEGFVILEGVEYLGTIGTHKVPCKCLAYVSEDTILTSLYHHNELYSGGVVNVKDFILKEE